MENGIIKLKEICKVYTDRLSELLADGYVLNAKTTPGTQGEYGRMDLTKDGGKTVRRIYMDRGYTNDGDLAFYSSVDTLSIRVFRPIPSSSSAFPAKRRRASARVSAS